MLAQIEQIKWALLSLSFFFFLYFGEADWLILK